MRAPQDALEPFQAALTSMLTNSPPAQAAFLFEMEQVDLPTSAALVVGIVAPRDEALVHAVGTVATEAYTGRLPIDVCFLAKGDARLAMLQQAAIRPFFERSWQGPAHPSPVSVQ